MTTMTTLALCALGGFILFRGKVDEVMDRFSNDKIISGLHPVIRPLVRKLLAAAEAEGIFLKLTDGMRTFQRQQDLYDQGRTKPGNVVTNAKPGQSFHNYGLAVDVVPIVDGKADWNSKHWDRIGQLGKSVGLVWGGDFKSLTDKPHFEYPKGYTVSKLLALYNAGAKDAQGFLTGIV